MPLPPAKVCISTYKDDEFARELIRGITDVLFSLNITNCIANTHPTSAEHAFEPHTVHELCILIETFEHTSWFRIKNAGYSGNIRIYRQGESIEFIYPRESQIQLSLRMIGNFLGWMQHDYLGIRVLKGERSNFTPPIDSAFPKSKIASTVQA